MFEFDENFGDKQQDRKLKAFRIRLYMYMFMLYT